MKHATPLAALALALTIGAPPLLAHAPAPTTSVWAAPATAEGSGTAGWDAECTPTEISREGWTMWHCVDAEGNESWPWKRHVACSALGLGTGLLFTPLTGALVGVTCRVLIPTPAYNYLPATPVAGYGMWMDDDFMEQGDFQYDEYRYDASTDEYWMEVTSYDYPLSESYDFRYGDGGGCPLGQRRCDYPI